MGSLWIVNRMKITSFFLTQDALALRFYSALASETGEVTWQAPRLEAAHWDAELSDDS